MLVLCIIITAIFLGIGIYFSDSNISNFLCSCAVGLSCGYITGWISSYFADKQTASLLELDYRISKCDELAKMCEFETNVFPHGSMLSPKKVNVYNLGEDMQYYFVCLCRMGAVFKEISSCDIWELSNITVDFYVSDNKSEKIKLKDFSQRLEHYFSEQYTKNQKICLSPIQCNNMFANAMNIKCELGKIKEKLIREKENLIFKRK